MTRIRAVLLDMDDTLCDSEGLTAIRLEAVQQSLSDSVEPTLLKNVMQEALSWDSVGVPGKYQNRIARMAEQLELDEEATNRMRAVYNTVLMDKLRLYDGVEDMLVWLRDRVSLGLITNGPSELQRGKIDLLGIEPYFRSIAVGGEVGAYKPDPKIFDHCLNELGVSADEALYVGDRTEADVVGARDMGIIAIRIHKSYPFPMADDPAPDFFLDHVTELPALMIDQGWLSPESGAATTGIARERGGP